MNIIFFKNTINANISLFSGEWDTGFGAVSVTILSQSWFFMLEKLLRHFKPKEKENSFLLASSDIKEERDQVTYYWIFLKVFFVFQKAR